MTDNDTRLPVTLLTGFLGAGKTTLLNSILQDHSIGRVAVVVNEFGDAGLDHDLIETSEDDIILMNSGCLCCSIRGDLSKTLSELIARREKGSIEFNRLIIETTGLADPAPILQTILVDPILASTVRMDGVVTVADCVAGPSTLDAQFEAVSQIAMADLIVMSKIDVVSKLDRRQFEKRLRNLNLTASILFAEHGKVDSKKMFGLSSLRRETQANQAIAWLTPQKMDPFSNLSRLAPKLERLELSRHDTRIQSVSIVLDKPLPSVAFDIWLDTLIALKGPDILRVKGIVFLEDIRLPFVFHGVQHIFEPPVQLKEWLRGDTCSRIVVIAKDISRPELQRSFDALRASQSGGEN